MSILETLKLMHAPLMKVYLNAVLTEYLTAEYL